MHPGNLERRASLVATLMLGTLLTACRKEPLRSNREERIIYRAMFHDIGGLRAGDDVRYAGLAVGAVNGVALDAADPRRVIVTFGVRTDLPVRADARAMVPLVTIPTAHYIVLVPASLDAPRLRAGAVVPSVETLSPADMLLRVSEVLDRTDTLLSATRTLADAGTFEHLARATARIDTLTALATRDTRRLSPQLGRIASRADTLLDRTNALLDRTNALLATVDSSRADLAALPGATVQTLQETRRMLAELREGLSQGGGLSNVTRDLSISARNLARITTELQRDPLSPLRRRSAPAKPSGPRP